MTGIAIVGAAGRMGTALVRCLAAYPSLRLAAALERPGHPALGRDAGDVAGAGPAGVALCDNPSAAAAQADVLIDFSSREAAALTVACALKAGRAVVLGTTALADAEAAAVRSAAARIPIVWAPNMSLGVNVLLALVERAARVLGPAYDAEVVEAHHRHKKDAPSGTALALARRVAAGREVSLESAACHGRSGLVGERPAGQIGIHAVRGGDIVGDHTVMFAADGERIEFTHRATSRDAFAMGALRAAQWVAGRIPGLYDMRDVLGLTGTQG